MNKLFLISMALLVLSCGGRPRESDLQYLSGYWEIEKVVLENGDEKSYPFNPTIDYIFLEPDYASGYRKKVQPQITGTYLTSDDSVPFLLRSGSEGFYELVYDRNGDRWQERLIELGPEHLILQGASGVKYHYKRHQSLLPIYDPVR